MFDSLSDRLGGVFDRLRGRGALSEADVREAMREVRIALLEADVALPVVRQFIDSVTERAIGQNELQTQIELARREEELVSQRGANARRQAEEAAAAGEIATDAEARRTERLAVAKAEATRSAGVAEGEAEAARVAAYMSCRPAFSGRSRSPYRTPS